MRAGPHAADTINHPCTCTFMHAWASHTVTRHHHRPFRRWARAHKSPLLPDDKRGATASPTGNCHSHRHVTGKDLTVGLSSPQIWKDLEFLPQSKSDFNLFPRVKGFWGRDSQSMFFPAKEPLAVFFSARARDARAVVFLVFRTNQFFTTIEPSTPRLNHQARAAHARFAAVSAPRSHPRLSALHAADD